MDYIAKTTSIDKENAEFVIVGLFKPKRLSASARKLDKLYRGNISRLCQKGVIDGNLGRVTTLHNSGRSKHDCIIIVGCGEESKFTISSFQRALSEAVHEIKKLNASE